jgi:hypothetical protein
MTFCGVFRAYLAAEKEFDFLAGVIYLWPFHVLLFFTQERWIRMQQLDIWSFW